MNRAQKQNTRKVRGFVAGRAILMITVSRAQFASRFGGKSTAWAIRVFGLDGFHTDGLAHVSDTLVDEMLFHKFDRYTGSMPRVDCGYVLRENAVSGKIWFFSLSYHDPVVLMGLSPEVGDFFEPFSKFGDVSEVIVTYTDVLGRYTVEFDSPIWGLSEPESSEFTEGYDPNLGAAFANGDCPTLSPYALCHYKDDVVTGHAAGPGLASVCNVDSMGLSDRQDGAKITLWSNPVADRYAHLKGLPSGA